MANVDRMRRALESFRQWEQPWKYIEAVLAYRELQDDEIQLISEIWAEATNAKSWAQPSVLACEELVRQKLIGSYSWLSTSAIDSLIRAACYEWK